MCFLTPYATLTPFNLKISSWRWKVRKRNFHLCNRLSMTRRQCEGERTSLTEMNYVISLQPEAEVSWLLFLTSDTQTALSTISSCCPQFFTSVRLMDLHGTFTSRTEEKEKEWSDLRTSGRQKKVNEIWQYLLHLVRNHLTLHGLLERVSDSPCTAGQCPPPHSWISLDFLFLFFFFSSQHWY